jgi:hypothetical protein
VNDCLDLFAVEKAGSDRTSDICPHELDARQVLPGLRDVETDDTRDFGLTDQPPGQRWTWRLGDAGNEDAPHVSLLAYGSLRPALARLANRLERRSRRDECHFLLRRWTRVRLSSLRCFFFAMRLRRFLMTDPTGRPRLIIGTWDVLGTVTRESRLLTLLELRGMAAL